MATEKITIVVEERGARVVKRNIEDIGKSGEVAQRGIDGLRGALAGLATAGAVTALVKLLDTFTNMQNKIRNITTDTAELRVITAELGRVANGTRQSLESTVDLYTQMSLAAKDLGTSQQELINFTESINQVVAMSGVSAEAAKNALTQLGQGLGSPALRGEELNSLLEQLPQAADVIARHLGVTRGELKKLGEDGKITAEKVLAAFRAAREELAERFARSVPTIAQSFQVLKNNVTLMAGEFDKATGLSTALANALLLVSDNLGTIARVAAAAAIVVGTVLARTAFGALLSALGMLAAAIAANPIGAMLVVVTAGIALLTTFSDKIMLTSESITTLKDFAVAAWEQIKAGLQVLADYIGAAFAPQVALAKAVFGEMEFSILGILKTAASTLDDVIGLFIGTYNAMKAAWAGLPAAIKEIFITAMNGAVATVEAGINRIILALNSIASLAGTQLLAPLNLPRIQNSAEGAGARLGAGVAEGFREGFQSRPTTALLEGVVNRANELAQQRRQANQQREMEDAAARQRLGQSGPNRVPAAEDDAKKGRQRQQVTFEELFKQLQDENAILKANREDREALTAVLAFEDQLRRQLTATERSMVEQMVKENEALERLNRAHEDITGPQRRVSERIQDLNTLFEQGRVSITEYEREMRKLRVAASDFDNSLSGGLENGLARLAERANDFGKGISDQVVGAFSDATDAIVDFAKTGEFNVQKMLSSISERLLRFASDQLFASIAQSLLGGSKGGGGGLGSLIGSLAGAAGGEGGGVASLLSSVIGAIGGFRTGGSFEVGGSGGPDTKLVAFRATPGERVDVSTPAQQARQESSGSSAQPAVVQVVNVTDPKESVAGMRSAAGQQIIMNVIERNAPALRRTLGIA